MEITTNSVCVPSYLKMVITRAGKPAALWYLKMRFILYWLQVPKLIIILETAFLVINLVPMFLSNCVRELWQNTLEGCWRGHVTHQPHGRIKGILIVSYIYSMRSERSPMLETQLIYSASSSLPLERFFLTFSQNLSFGNEAKKLSNLSYPSQV